MPSAHSHEAFVCVPKTENHATFLNSTFFHFLFAYLPGVMWNYSKQFSTDTTMHAAESTLLAAPTTHVRTRTSHYTIKMTLSLMSFTVVSFLSASSLLGGAILSCDALRNNVCLNIDSVSRYCVGK